MPRRPLVPLSGRAVPAGQIAPAFPPVLPSVLRDYLTAQQTYETARHALITTFAAAVPMWRGEEKLTEFQITARLRAVQVPEELLQPILDAALAQADANA